MKYFVQVLSFILFLSLVIIQSAEPVQKKRVAVLQFKSNNTSKSYADIVRDIMEVRLYETDCFDIVERNRIDLILKEQGFEETGRKLMDLSPAFLPFAHLEDVLVDRTSAVHSLLDSVQTGCK